MNVTVNCDASFSNKYSVGTYAFWIVSNLGRITGSGPLRKRCVDSTDAEIKCILNALAMIAMNFDLMVHVKNIYVNTDSLNAIHLLSGDKEAIKKFRLKKYNHLLMRYTLIMSKLKGKDIHFSHVRAHQDTDTKRSWVNDWLDKAAKDEMGLLLTKIKTKKP